MPVEIKPLKGFSNPINNESNTLSLLVKSDYDLYEHLNESRNKLISLLNSILNYFKYSDIKFYHKVQIPLKFKNTFITSRCYKLSFDSIKVTIDNSLKDVIESCPNSFTSHFINIFVKEDGDTIILNNDKFIKVNHIIRCAINNNHMYDFSNDYPFEKIMTKIDKENRYIKKQTKIVNERYLSVLKQHIEYLTL